MKYTIEGTILSIGETEQYGASFTKRVVVLKSGTEQYPRGIPLEFQKEDTAMVDQMNVGDVVSFDFYIEGSPDRRKEGRDKFYAALHAKGFTIKAKATSNAGTADSQNGSVTMQQAVDTWKKYHGEDIAAFGAFCKNARPDIVEAAAKAGVKFSDFAKNRGDVWGEIVAKIEAEAAGNTGDQFTEDEMPF